MLPETGNKNYRIQGKEELSLQQPLGKSSFPRLVVLLFLLVALVTFFYPGHTHTADNALSPRGNSLFFMDQTSPFPGECGEQSPPAAQHQRGQGQEHTGANGYPEPAGPDAPPAGLDVPPAGPDESHPTPLHQTPGAGKSNPVNPDSGSATFISPDPGIEKYDYSSPVPPVGIAVTDDYFHDAVFIGDSRTAGLQLYSGPPQARYYTANGLKVDTFFTREIVDTGSGRKMTVPEALQQTPFKKVYIMLGINELGWAYSELFIKKYGEIITEIQNIAPGAQIYVQSLLPVSKKRSLSDAIYNNDNIGKYNVLIQQMAAERKLYYLDVAQCVADPEGNLAGDASTDGIHLQKTYCDLWLDYLKQHYVSL